MQKLTAACVKQAKPRDKAFSLVDGGGLYVLVKRRQGTNEDLDAAWS